MYEGILFFEWFRDGEKDVCVHMCVHIYIYIYINICVCASTNLSQTKNSKPNAQAYLSV